MKNGVLVLILGVAAYFLMKQTGLLGTSTTSTGTGTGTGTTGGTATCGASDADLKTVAAAYNTSAADKGMTGMQLYQSLVSQASGNIDPTTAACIYAALVKYPTLMQPLASSTGTTVATGTTGATTTPAQGTSTTTIAVQSKADQLQAKVVAFINSSGVSSTYISGSQSPDTWNYFLMQVTPGYTAPAPESMFPNASDAHAPVTFQTWWAAVLPFLQSSGLAGLGWRRRRPVGVYGGWAT